MITFKKKLLLNSIGPERVIIVAPYLLVIQVPFKILKLMICSFTTVFSLRQNFSIFPEV